jgi:hypothetical protein
MTDVTFGDAGGIMADALQDATREAVVGRERNLVAETIAEANSNLDEAAAVNEWDVQNVKSSVDVEVNETETGIGIRISYDHPASEFFEFGTSAHTIQGRPVLSFVWEERHDPPEWVREEFESATSDKGRPGYQVFFSEVEVEGIPETRFLRDALRFFQRQMEAMGQ